MAKQSLDSPAFGDSPLQQTDLIQIRIPLYIDAGPDPKCT